MKARHFLPLALALILGAAWASVAVRESGRQVPVASATPSPETAAKFVTESCELDLPGDIAARCGRLEIGDAQLPVTLLRRQVAQPLEGAAVARGVEVERPAPVARPARLDRVAAQEEIAATFDHAGVAPYFHLGAAEIFRLLGRTPFAQETPETIDKSRTLADTIRVVAQHLPAKVESGD
jgi:hypothetical protein